LCKVFRTT